MRNGRLRRSVRCRTTVARLNASGAPWIAEGFPHRRACSSSARPIPMPDRHPRGATKPGVCGGRDPGGVAHVRERRPRPASLWTGDRPDHIPAVTAASAMLRARICPSRDHRRPLPHGRLPPGPTCRPEPSPGRDSTPEGVGAQADRQRIRGGVGAPPPRVGTITRWGKMFAMTARPETGSSDSSRALARSARCWPVEPRTRPVAPDGWPHSAAHPQAVLAPWLDTN